MKTCLRLLLPLLFVFANTALAASLFSAAPASSPTARTKADAAGDEQLDRLRQSRTAKQITVIQMNLKALDQPTVDIDLPARARAKATRAKIKRRAAKDYTWFGKLNGTPDDAVLVVRDGRVTGSIRHGKDLFRITPLSNDQHALVEVDQSAFPPEEPDSASADAHGLNSDEAINARLKAAQDSATADAQTIDLMVVYTNAAQNQSGDIQGLIQLAIDETNQGYQNSGITARVRLVHTHKVTYNEGGRSYDTVLDHLEGKTDGQMDEIHALRDQYGADAVMMIFNQGDYCGQASTIMANASNAFALVHWDCATGYYSFGHELAHLQGARHDPATDSTNTPFRYGHGYRYQNQWRTVLAYDCDSNCPRLNYYSNPNVLRNGVPTGTADRSHNARVLNETAATVAAFRILDSAEQGASLEKFVGPVCKGANCTGWQQLDIGRTASMASASTALYQITIDGSVMAYTGTPCSGGVCNGWQLLDNAGNAESLTATSGNRLYQLRDNGDLMRYTGTPCAGATCSGWQKIDAKPNISGLAANAGQLYQLLADGTINRYNNTACSGTTCNGWKKIGNQANTKAIAAGADFYRLQTDGVISRYTGTQCSGTSCPGWEMVGNHAATVAIAAAGDELYQLRNDGRILRYTGVACAGAVCDGWELMGNNAATTAIVAGGTKLYSKLNDGSVLRSSGAVCSGGTCGGWKLLDNDLDTGALGAASSNLYQLRN